MPSDRKNRKDRKNPTKSPNVGAWMHFATGQQLWGTATKPHKKRTEMTVTDDTHPNDDRLWGYLLTVTLLQPLAAEYSLKGLSVLKTDQFRPTHDPLDLYEALAPETREHLAEDGEACGGLDIPAFLKAHRNEFVDLRYPRSKGCLAAPTPRSSTK